MAEKYVIVCQLFSFVLMPGVTEIDAIFIIGNQFEFSQLEF